MLVAGLSGRELKARESGIRSKLNMLKGLDVPTIATAISWAVGLLAFRERVFSISRYKGGVHVTKMVFVPNKQGKYRLVTISLTLEEVDSLPTNI